MKGHATSGTPTDCVTLGYHVLMEERCDLVVSGINSGANLGWDLTYSGTVSAAMEASILGLQAFAVSLAWRLQQVKAEEGEPEPEIDVTPEKLVEGRKG